MRPSSTTTLSWYANKHMHKHPPLPKSYCKSNRRLASRLRSHSVRKNYRLARTAHQAAACSQNLTDCGAENATAIFYNSVAVHLSTDQTTNLESNICSTPGLLGGWRIAGHNNRVPSVSQQWAQSHLWPPWLWHLAGCCNLSASQPDSHIHNRGRSWHTLSLGLIVLHQRTVFVHVYMCA